MQRSLACLALAGVLLAATSPADAAPCASVRMDPGTARQSPCRRPHQAAAPLKSYDPDAVRAGRDPGFVDLGNGTEVRIGGRARFDYDARR